MESERETATFLGGGRGVGLPLKRGRCCRSRRSRYHGDGAVGDGVQRRDGHQRRRDMERRVQHVEISVGGLVGLMNKKNQLRSFCEHLAHVQMTDEEGGRNASTDAGMLLSRRSSRTAVDVEPCRRPESTSMSRHVRRVVHAQALHTRPSPRLSTGLLSVAVGGGVVGGGGSRFLARAITCASSASTVICARNTRVRGRHVRRAVPQLRREVLTESSSRWSPPA